VALPVRLGDHLAAQHRRRAEGDHGDDQDEDADRGHRPGATAVRLGQVQPPGKKMMNALDWARGARLAPGTVIG
ncbi:hypothetical protein ACFWF3_33105, partial [Nocardia sp. NPDC060220]